MSLQNAEFLDIFILLSIQNFMLSCVEHDKSFITSEPDCLNIRNSENIVVNILSHFLALVKEAGHVIK